MNSMTMRMFPPSNAMPMSWTIFGWCRLLQWTMARSLDSTDVHMAIHNWKGRRWERLEERTWKDNTSVRNYMYIERWNWCTVEQEWGIWLYSILSYLADTITYFSDKYTAKTPMLSPEVVQKDDRYCPRVYIHCSKENLWTKPEAQCLENLYWRHTNNGKMLPRTAALYTLPHETGLLLEPLHFADRMDDEILKPLYGHFCCASQMATVDSSKATGTNSARPDPIQ